jgi:TldD protein
LKRRNFIYLTGVGAAAAMLPAIPVFGKEISPEQALTYIDPAAKKILSDVALNAARSKGATYTDVRVGRYLNQYVVTREDKVENIVNTESYGIGIRVIANGSWVLPQPIKWTKTVLQKQQRLR